MGGLAEVGHIFAGVTGRFGDKVAQILHQLAAHRFLTHDLFTLKRCPNARVKVLQAAAEFEEPGLVIDARAQERDLVVGHTNPTRQHLGGALHAMAKTHVRPARSIGHRPAVDRHWIHIVEQQRIGREFIHVIAQIQKNRDRPQATKHAAGAERVAHALLDAILARNINVQRIGIQPALLKSRDDVSGIFDSFLLVDRRLDARLEAAPVNDGLHQFAAALQPHRINVHQRDGAVLEHRSEQNIAAQVAGKDDAARADEGDF